MSFSIKLLPNILLSWKKILILTLQATIKRLKIVSRWSKIPMSLLEMGQTNGRSSHNRCSIKIDVLTNFEKFTGKHLLQNLWSLKPATLFKKRLWHRYFPVKFAEFLRTTFSQNTSERLLLNWKCQNLVGLIKSVFSTLLNIYDGTLCNNS